MCKCRWMVRESKRWSEKRKLCRVWLGVRPQSKCPVDHRLLCHLFSDYQDEILRRVKDVLANLEWAV